MASIPALHRRGMRMTGAAPGKDASGQRMPNSPQGGHIGPRIFEEPSMPGTEQSGERAARRAAVEATPHDHHEPHTDLEPLLEKISEEMTAKAANRRNAAPG